jgi:molybdopterin converting factor small subunit
VRDVRVQVRVYGGLERYVPVSFGEAMEVELREGATARDLLAVLGVPEKEVFSILVNGRHRTPPDPLAAGDRVALFPPVAGG